MALDPDLPFPPATRAPLPPGRPRGFTTPSVSTTIPSIPARHDVARPSDCAYLATRVATGRLRESEAHEVAHDLSYRLAKAVDRL